MEIQYPEGKPVYCVQSPQYKVPVVDGQMMRYPQNVQQPPEPVYVLYPVEETRSVCHHPVYQQQTNYVTEQPMITRSIPQTGSRDIADFSKIIDEVSNEKIEQVKVQLQKLEEDIEILTNKNIKSCFKIFFNSSK